PDRNIFLIDAHTIRRVSAEGMVSTLVGAEPANFTPEYVDGGPSVARFEDPIAIALDPAGNLYVVEADAHTVRKIATDLTVSTYAGMRNRAGRTDGPLREAQFRFPSDVAIDDDGTMYVTDDCTLRRVTGETVTTLLGRPVPPAIGCVDNIDGPFATATLINPDDIALDSSGNLYLTTSQTYGSSYVASSRNTIRKLTPSGFVSTIAGDDGKGERYRDATGRAAQFYNIGSIALDGSGGLYVTEFVADTIRWVSPGGEVTTIGGLPGLRGTAEGTALDARFKAPHAILTDPDGNLIIEEGGIRLRIGRPALSDQATIDAIVAVAGGTRQLDSSPRTATSWKWEMIRRPSATQSSFSSDLIRNPTFVTDLEDLYEFRLTATNSIETSITTAFLIGQEGIPTPLGNQVVVAGPGASLTFPAVTRAGRTLIAALPIGAELPDALPSWLVFDVTTTAVFTAPARFCVALPRRADVAQLDAFRLFQSEGESLVDRTSSRDPAGRTICASLPSLGRVILGGPVTRGRPVSR
ncbi:MAG TPA: hypothetical protein VM534_10560, partial [Thermoanaerobaculia bacterium]|nr:hypothetical protein [Thermoanaerobaculia bacterium]